MNRKHSKYDRMKWIKLVTANSLHNFIRDSHREDRDFVHWQSNDDEKNKNSSSRKSGSTSASIPVKNGNDQVKLKLEAFDIAVGQRYDTKDTLETRLKIMSVLHQFDFRVDRSATNIFMYVENLVLGERKNIVLGEDPLKHKNHNEPFNNNTKTQRLNKHNEPFNNTNKKKLFLTFMYVESEEGWASRPVLLLE